MMGGMADIGYLIFIEFVGYVNVFPRTLMTLVPASAIILVCEFGLEVTQNWLKKCLFHPTMTALVALTSEAVPDR